MNAIETLETLSANGLFTDGQARALVRAMENSNQGELDATTDILRADLRASESRLEAKIESVRGDLLKWGIATVFATAGLVLAGVYFLLAHFKP